MTEEWRAIPGYEGRYEVSDLGRVRSLRHRSVIRNRIKKPNRVGDYYVIQLHRTDGTRERVRVNRLVLTVFVGPAPDGYDGAHQNGDSLDNRLSNLAWKTKSENNQDRVKHGTWSNGSDRGRGRWNKK